MSFPKYEEYKDSGVTWLGEVPNHWELAPLISIAIECNASNKGMVENNLLSLSYGRIVRKDINTNDGLLPESFETYQIIEVGDIVLRLTDLQNDQRSLRSGLVEERGIITSAYTAIRPLHANSVFIAYLLRAYDTQKVFYSMGGGLRQSMKFSELRRLPMLLPPLPEQAAIATFLDRETAKIDELVAEQEKLIELLKEKRQAVISHAVTKGLNPDAPMKDSGIEWLGEVPEHWEVKRIKMISSTISKGTTPTTIGADFTDVGVRFIKAENIGGNGQIITEPEFYISAETHQLLSRSSLAAGDVLVVIAGATTGKSTVLDGCLLPANTNQAVSFIRCKDPSLSTFIQAWLSISKIQEVILLTSVQSAQPNLSMEDLGNIPIPIPPHEEITFLMEFVSSSSIQLEALIAQAQRAINLLKERRSALISAAVTGKIDVRHLANTKEVA
jgi:type I restriction enzyme S subunit